MTGQNPIDDNHDEPVQKKHKTIQDDDDERTLSFASLPKAYIQTSSESLVTIAVQTETTTTPIDTTTTKCKVFEWDDINIINEISQLIEPNSKRMDVKYRLPPELRTIDFTKRISWDKYAPYNPTRLLPLVPINEPPKFTKENPSLCHYVHAISGRARACTIHFLQPSSSFSSTRQAIIPKQGIDEKEFSNNKNDYSHRQRPLPTPMFMPVGTKGCLKALSILELMTDPALQCPIILANTYHLAIQPGTELVRDMGGLHHFQGMDNVLLKQQQQQQEQQQDEKQPQSALPYNLLTDSGGFQMVSLAKLSEVTEEGVSFENPYKQKQQQQSITQNESIASKKTKNGFDKDFQKNSNKSETTAGDNNDMDDVDQVVPNEDKDILKNVEATDTTTADILLLRPEDSIRHQNNIGSNIMMALDDVISSVTVDEQRFVTATHRTLRWYDRCYKYHHYTNPNTQNNQHQSLFPIVQGGLDIEYGGLREQCLAGFMYRQKQCHYIVPGYSIGGLAGGETKNDFWKVVDLCCKALPDNKPRYLMGVGYPLDLIVCTSLGVDMYDCVYPTRTARFGVALVPGKHPGTLKLISNACGRDTKNVIQNDCVCQACRNGITRSRLHALLKANNPVGVELVTQHNIAYMMTLVREMRNAILSNTFKQYVIQFVYNQFPGGLPSNGDTTDTNHHNNKEAPSIPTWVVDALTEAGINIKNHIDNNTVIENDA